MRTLTTIAKRSLFSQETDLVWLALLKIEHSTLATPIRVANNTVDVVSNWEDGVTNETFQAFPFQLDLPAERDESPPTVRLTIDNVDRQIVQAVRNLTGPPTITLVIVTDNDFNNVEIGPMVFTMFGVDFDAQTVSGNLAYEPVLNEPYPSGTFNPADFPALFILLLSLGLGALEVLG